MPTSKNPPKPAHERLFPPTSQTLLTNLQVEDSKTREVSLARFCTAYYPAIYGFARKLGLTVEDAQDRTQDFFMEVVRDGLLGHFDSAHGARFCSWLMKCFKNLELNHRASRATAKRGGGHLFVEFDADKVEHSFQSAHRMDLQAEPAFDLVLARGIWRMTREQVLTKHAATPNAALVVEILPFILAERWPAAPAPSQDEMAARHGTTSARLKAFFNRTLKLQVRRIFGETAVQSSPGIADAEISELWALLGQYGED